MLPSLQQCTSLAVGSDLWGNDLLDCPDSPLAAGVTCNTVCGFFNVTDAAACEQMCVQHPSCGAFTFKARGECWLKPASGFIRMPCEDCYTCVLPSAAAQLPPAQPDVVGATQGEQLERGPVQLGSWHASGLVRHPQKPAQALQLTVRWRAGCAASRACMMHLCAHSPADSHNGLLQCRRLIPKPSGTEPQRGAHSCTVAPRPLVLAAAGMAPTCGTVQSGTDLLGGDLQTCPENDACFKKCQYTNVTNMAACCDLCANKEGCSAYTFLTDGPNGPDSVGMCFLKG